MNIDRVARGMTDANGPRGWRGPSGPAFTARVMAPVYGRPRPDFTARVMRRIDEAPVAQASASVAQAFRPAFKAALFLAPVAIALLTVAALFARTGSLRIPTAPAVPRLTGVPYDPGPIGMPPLPIDRWAVSKVPRVRIAAARPQAAEVPLPERPPIHTIAALEGPTDIGLKPIGPEAVVIAPLQGPAPLKISEIKEKS